MRGTPTISTPDFIRNLLDEARRYPPENLDHQWRMNTAWQRYLSLIGIPVIEQTDTPSADFGPHYLHPEQRAA